MGRRQQFTFDGIGTNGDTLAFPEKNGNDISVSKATIFIYVLVSIVVAAAVGVIVHFVHPCRQIECDCSQCPVDIPQTTAAISSPPAESTEPITTSGMMTSEDELWEQCVNLSWSKNQCFRDAFPCEGEMEVINYYLPKTFIPQHYKLEVIPDIYQPHFSNFSHSGSVTIHLLCMTSTDVIFIHFRELTIDNSAIIVNNQAGSNLIINYTSVDEIREFLKIHLNSKVNQGEYITVHLSYTGHLSIDMVGIYFSDYVVKNETKFMVATQLEATAARKAFPCLDEPALKATFEMTIWRKEPMVALTNMPKISSQVKPDGWIADYFGTTAVAMPTYLVAFAVAEYSHIEGWANSSISNKLLRHWSRPDYIEKGMVDFSLGVCIDLYNYFEIYFNFPYEMPKTDQISIDDFDSGAMENWGLITYREGRIVWDPDHSTLHEKQRATGTLSHELLHQWLGNVVTCSWWSDLWLQEGMARYHQHLAMAATLPWDIDQVYAAQVIYRAFRSDQSGHSAPIHNPVNSPSEIEAMFSIITYDKAGCVIRMIKELVLGDTTYQAALQEYVRNHAYGSTGFQDLLDAWDEQAAKDGITLEVNVTTIMLPWIMQMGYPMVTMERTNTNTVRMTQNIFLEIPDAPLEESYPSNYNYIWHIPVSYVTSQDPANMRIEWMHSEYRSVTLTGLSAGDWFLGNYKQYGFYRVNYDENNWKALANQLKNNHKVFHILNRGQLIDDSIYLSRAGYLDHVTHLKLTEYLSNETDYLPWHAAHKAFDAFSRTYRNHAGFSIFRKYVRNLLQPNYENLGWEERPGDTHHDIYLRDLTLTEACHYGNSDCINRARAYFQAWQDDPNNATIIRPDIRDAVYCTVISNGLSDDWEFLFSQYQNFQHFSREKARRRRALACSQDKPTLTRLFHMAATSSNEIMSHDINGPASMTRDIARTPIGHYVAWEYLNSNWGQMVHSTTILAAIAETFSTEFDLQKYDAFVANHSPTFDSEQKTFDDIRRIISHNVRWRTSNEHSVFTWLDDVTISKTNA